MALTSTLIANTNTTISPSTSFSGSQTGIAITCMIFCNYTSNTPASITVFAVPNGGSANNTTMIINSLSIPGGETVSLDQEKLVLGNGDAIWVQSGTTSYLSIVVSTLPV